MRVLLTGASGFIGAHAAAALVRRGHQVRALARPTSDLSGLDGLPYDRALGDLRGDGLAAACHNVDAVLHLAGLTAARSSAEFARVNARGAGLLVRAAADAAVGRFLYVSSLAAFGPSPDGAMPDPAAPCAPITDYGRSKAAGEAEALTCRDRMAVQILRPPVVYGPYDRGLLPFFQFARWRVLPLLGGGSHTLSIIHARDLAEAMVALLEAPPGDSPFFHVQDGGGPYTWRQLGEAIALAVDHRVWAVPLPVAGFRAAGVLSELGGRLLRRPRMLTRDKVLEMRQPAWIGDNAALSAATGWAPRIPLLDGVRETAAWYRVRGWT